MRYPVTPDGRYFMVRGRLWRCSDPALRAGEREHLTRELMAARRSVRNAKNPEGIADARARVDVAKRALGERGPPWWTDGAPDLNRRMASGTPYAEWASGLPAVDRTLADPADEMERHLGADGASRLPPR